MSKKGSGGYFLCLKHQNCEICARLPHKSKTCLLHYCVPVFKLFTVKGSDHGRDFFFYMT